MKIYLVMYNGFDDVSHSFFCGVYSSREKAEKAISESKRYGYKVEDYEIVETILDP